MLAIDRAFGQSYYTSGVVIDVREDLVAGHVWKHALLAFGVGVATDVGGGTSYSMLQTLGEAYKVAMEL